MWQERILARIFVSEINRAIGSGDVLTIEQTRKMMPPQDRQPNPVVEENQEIVFMDPPEGLIVVNERTISATILITYRDQLFKSVRALLKKTNSDQMSFSEHDEMRFLRTIDPDFRYIILQLCSEIPSQTLAIEALRDEAIKLTQEEIDFTQYEERAFFLNDISLVRKRDLENRKQATSWTKGFDEIEF